jgi:hypothetical protein
VEFWAHFERMIVVAERVAPGITLKVQQLIGGKIWVSDDAFKRCGKQHPAE